MAARDDAHRLLDRAQRGVQKLLPPDPFLADAHTHLGLDEDGMRLDLETMLEQMREWNVRRALVFPLHEADRAPAYRAPNDRVLGWAAESDGLLVPLARLDLDQSPIDEARRCLALGARGIKLHPRAQTFTVDDDRLEPVFALAEEHRLPVLIHAGRGMPPIGEHLATVAARHPGRDPDPRARRDRRPGAHLRPRRRARERLLRHLDLGRRPTCSTCCRASRRSRCCGRPTCPYGNHLASLTLIGADPGRDRRVRARSAAASSAARWRASSTARRRR